MEPCISQGGIPEALVAPLRPVVFPRISLGPSAVSFSRFQFRVFTSGKGHHYDNFTTNKADPRSSDLEDISLSPHSPPPTYHNASNFHNATNRIFQGRCARSIHRLYTIPVLTPYDGFASRPS